MYPFVGVPPCRHNGAESSSRNAPERILLMSLRVGCVTMDAGDCRGLGQSWAAALGWKIVSDTEEGVYLVPQEVVGQDSAVPGLLLFLCHNLKSAKNRVHLDLRPDDQAAENRASGSLGATRAMIGQTGAEPWVVMADPEGNEFRVLTARYAVRSPGPMCPFAMGLESPPRLSNVSGDQASRRPGLESGAPRRVSRLRRDPLPRRASIRPAHLLPLLVDDGGGHRCERRGVDATRRALDFSCSTARPRQRQSRQGHRRGDG